MTPGRARQGCRKAASSGDRSGADPRRCPCTLAWRRVAPSRRSGRRRKAPTIDPAEVPTMTSADRASYPTSDNARSSPRWKASPVTPPAPSTRPIRVTSGLVPRNLLGIPGSVVPGTGDARGVLELADHSCRVARDKCVVRDVLADDGTGGDEATAADRHAGQDDRARADPRAVADADRLLLHRSSLHTVAVAVHDIDLVGERDVIADGHLARAEHDRSAVDEAPVAEPDPAPPGDERLSMNRPHREAVTDDEVGRIDARSAEHDRPLADGRGLAQLPVGIEDLLADRVPPLGFLDAASER